MKFKKKNLEYYLDIKCSEKGTDNLEYNIPVSASCWFFPVFLCPQLIIIFYYNVSEGHLYYVL